MNRLTLDDIADARAYERERDELRARVIELKKKRRVAVGPVVSVVFENRETVRFQIQEMARTERLYTDAAIQAELDVYNPLIPGPGELSATLYVELTSRQEMEKWLPRLVGIERSVRLEIGEPASIVPCEVDPAHAANLTREEVTAAVHFVRFSLDPDEVSAWSGGPVALAIDHPNYRHRAPLGAETLASLLEDLTASSGGA